ncbi:hypothetical protein [Terrimonas alba]|uniref:hypothetical protein n=1 Tax=Terrimonas alba TaxID=3349636 RepID=UPI0035F2F0AC
MRRIILLFVTICLFVNSYAAFALEAPPLKANEVYITIGKNGEKVSLLDLSRMKIKELQQLTGKRMKLIDRIGFSLAQKQLRESINNDGTFNSKKMQKALKRAGDGTTGFHIGGFALGFLLGLIGVLIAYLIKDDKKANRTKWAWIGVGVAVLLYILLLI